MKKIYLALIAVSSLSLIGCNEDKKQLISINEDNAVSLHFYASIESQPDSINKTKSTLSGTSSDAVRKVLWETTDSIYVTNGKSSSTFYNVIEENTDIADFSGEISLGTNYYAAFPYGIVSGYDVSVFNLTLPTIQPYKEDGVGSESFPMVAKCISNVFEFKNLCGILVLNLKGSATIDSIRFSGTDDTDKPIKVSGAANVNTSFTDSPDLVLDNNAVDYVILDCIGSSGKGVTLNPTKSTPFHIVLPAISFAQFRVVLYSSDGKKMTINSDKPLTIKRSKRTTASTIEYLADKPEYEFVDLGLSVNWATCNVGATKPEEYGDYYAWGETETKSTYSWSTYKWCNGSSTTMTKYCNDSSYGNNGFTDTKTILDPEDDVAHVKWGGNWRMPTLTEFEELYNNCTWSWTTFNWVSGYKVTSNKSGYTDRFIFLPAAGERNATSLYYAGSLARYWFSSLFADNPKCAFGLNCEYDRLGMSYLARLVGFPVRPVCPSETWVPVTSLSLDRTSVSMGTEGVVILSATAMNYGDVVNYPVTWSSDNTAIATVDQDGIVKAISLGTAIITATCEGVKASCTITVKKRDVNGYEYVDLGLSVLWATCNVGATKPEEYGDYYAWGETETKSTYDWSTYKWCNGSSSSLTKYNKSTYYGIVVDGKTTLDSVDDVAHVKWGGNWRMPTKKEFEELIINCTWTWTTMNGVKGYKVTSNKSGYTDRYIFLPAAECRDDISPGIASSGYYWSSSMSSEQPSIAEILYFNSDGYAQYAIKINYTFAYTQGRYCGQSVRPVFPSDTWVPETSLSLDRTSLSLETEESVKLSATARKDGDVVSYSVTWSSDNTAIATVDQDGNVKAISSGTAIITATCEGVKATCTVTVTTKKTPAPEYVDLGLSVLWASCNLGALSPEEYGDYYAWGETVTRNQTDMTNLNNYNYSGSYIRSYYTWATYKWGDGTPSGSDVIKYSSTDGKVTLDLGDDVANTIKGGKWRMPTYSEMAELLDNCTWIWTTYNDIYGYEVKSNINNNKIFLPAAGAYYNSFLDAPSTTGNYWSSTVDVSSRLYAKIIHFRSNSSNLSDHSLRDIGASIRPVYDENMEIHEYVDLGLSVKWATCNIGASSPEGYGDYYAWGETETKNRYYWPEYKYGGSTTITKYCDDYYSSFTDNKNILDIDDDVAHVKWGGNWRMPTTNEIDELKDSDKSIWTRATINNINGWLISSKVPGYEDSSIFLPASGYMEYSDIHSRGETAHYWSNGLGGTDSYGRCLKKGVDESTSYSKVNYRYMGLTVRAVCP